MFTWLGRVLWERFGPPRTCSNASRSLTTPPPTSPKFCWSYNVPGGTLALRLSGHLLLGVVRIYSKQVDYLFRDCALVTSWLSKSFVSTQVDLPEDARQAPVESVTLPQALNLDDFQLDDDTHEGEFDNHLRSQEDITLTDQIPTGVDPYVAITFYVGH